MTQPPLKFADIGFLDAHIQKTMDFYAPRCVDPRGGFFNFFRDDGSVYDTSTRHLVSSTRFVVNFAKIGKHFSRPDYLQLARHGLDYIEQRHLQPATGGYAWLINDTGVIDATNHGYGVAFAMLAYADALKANVPGAADGLKRVHRLFCERFWSVQDGLIVDEYNADFSVVSPYRGQNANMHACEALICAAQATGEEQYLTQALAIAENVTVHLAQQTDRRLVWEHYDAHWKIDWQYNRDDPKHLFRPWGFQPGHQTEWAKLLLTLHRMQPDAALVTRAQHLFDAAMAAAWDADHGGLFYGFAPDGTICDSDKYFWVQAESFAAAAMLAEATVEARYWRWVERLWGYCWTHFVDHQYGAWYRILDAQNRKYSDEKSPAGKVDYHTVGASLDVIEVLRRLDAAR